MFKSEMYIWYVSRLYTHIYYWFRLINYFGNKTLMKWKIRDLLYYSIVVFIHDFIFLVTASAVKWLPIRRKSAINQSINQSINLHTKKILPDRTCRCPGLNEFCVIIGSTLFKWEGGWDGSVDKRGIVQKRGLLSRLAQQRSISSYTMDASDV